MTDDYAPRFPVSVKDAHRALCPHLLCPKCDEYLPCDCRTDCLYVVEHNRPAERGTFRCVTVFANTFQGLGRASNLVSALGSEAFRCRMRKFSPVSLVALGLQGGVYIYKSHERVSWESPANNSHYAQYSPDFKERCRRLTEELERDDWPSY